MINMVYLNTFRLSFKLNNELSASADVNLKGEVDMRCKQCYKDYLEVSVDDVDPLLFV